MRTGRTKVFVGISMLLLAVIACQAPFLPPPTFTPRPPSELTIISQLETQTAQSPAVSTTSVLSPIPPDAVASQEPASPSGVSQPVEASATAVPSSSTLQPVEATLTSAAPVGVAHPVEATATSYIPPTDTASPLPVIPMVSVGSNTECRTGPSQFYKLVLRVGVGNKFMIVGRNSPTNYWIIRLADGRQCWLSGQSAIVEGNLNGLPEYSPPAVGRLEGEVKKSGDQNAGGVSQADVSIGSGGFGVYRTGNDGKFVFEDVPMGAVIITVNHDHYLFLPGYTFYVNSGQDTWVSIPALSPLIITLTPGGSIPTPTVVCRFLPRCIFTLPTLGPVNSAFPTLTPASPSLPTLGPLAP